MHALHAQVEHLTYLRKRGADLLVCVKGNQPTLRKRSKGLPWVDVPVGHTQTGRGHGRIEKCTMKVVTVEAGLGFPHAAQGIHIVRRSRPITPGTGKRAKWRTETVYAICTRSTADAHPGDLARWLRGHWAHGPVSRSGRHDGAPGSRSRARAGSDPGATLLAAAALVGSRGPRRQDFSVAVWLRPLRPLPIGR